MDNDKERNPEKARKAQRARKGNQRKQPRKDNSATRVNYDNTRVGKFIKDVSRDNDPSWYFNRADLSRSATQINFNHVTGMKEQIPNTIKLPSTGQPSYAVPGVCALAWDPVIAGTGRIAIAQASNSSFSKVVFSNSRTVPYDPQDQMILIIGTGLLYSFVANGIRAYGVMRDYEGLDMYTPDALLSAMGFQPDNLRDNYQRMGFDLNRLIAQMDQLWVPNTMPILERWFWMNTNIYRDGDSVKSQYYMYVPANYYVYDETTISTGAQLGAHKWLGFNTALHPWSDFMSAAQGMIDALVNSEDRGLILGQLLTAYGADKIYKLNPISLDYHTSIVFDREVLSQFENASVFGGSPGSIMSHVTEGIYSQGFTASAATLVNAQPGSTAWPILNFHQKEAPTPEQIMVATRMTQSGTRCIGKSTASTPLITLLPEYVGTETILDVFIYFYGWANGAKTLTALSYMQRVRQADGPNSSDRGWYWAWSAFDWAPWCVYHTYLTANDWSAVTAGEMVDIKPLLATGNYDNYVFLSDNQLDQLHTAAIYSLFDVPVSL